MEDTFHSMRNELATLVDKECDTNSKRPPNSLTRNERAALKDLPGPVPWYSKRRQDHL